MLEGTWLIRMNLEKCQRKMVGKNRTFQVPSCIFFIYLECYSSIVFAPVANTQACLLFVLHINMITQVHCDLSIKFS